MVKLLQSGWMCVLLGTLSYWGVTVTLLKGVKPVPGKKKAVEEVKEDPVWNKKPSWEFFNPDLVLLVDELKKERLDLDQRFKELDDWEERLKSEQFEITQVTQSVHRLRMEFDKSFLKIKEEENANLKKLAKLFSTMDPEVTVSLFEKMEDEQVVEYLVLMKDADSVTILETLAQKGAEQTERVRELTELLKKTLYRIDANKK